MHPGWLEAKLSAVLLCAVCVAGARGERIYGLTDSGELFHFHSSAPGVVTTIGPLTGVMPLHLPRAIDFRPSDGRLYLLSTNGTAAQLYTVNLETAGLKELGSSLTLGTTASGRLDMDFNPVTDELRIISGDGQNFRADPDSGTLIMRDTDILYSSGQGTLSGATPNLAGIAYTNNFVGAGSTTLYGYDYTYDHLATVGNIHGSPLSPNSGRLFDVGLTGVVSVTASIGMDISITGVAYVNAEDSPSAFDTLYTVALDTGAHTSRGLIGGGMGVLDIAVQEPEPNTLAILAMAGLTFARRRR